MSSVEEDRDMPGPDVSGPDVPGLDVATDPGLLLLEQYRSWMAEEELSAILVEEHAPAPAHAAAAASETAAEALVALEDALVELDASPGAMDGEALMATTLAVERARRRLDAANTRLMGRLDASGVTELRSGLRTKQWKAARSHTSVAAVGRELKLAQTLERFGGMADALRSGAISTEHVAALGKVCNDRTIDALVEKESAIVSFAKIHRFNVYVGYLRRLVAIVDTDGAEPDCGDTGAATMTNDFDGNLRIFMELSGHDAVEAEAIINAETDRQYRAAVREQEATGIPVPAMAVLRGRAMIELIRRGADPNPTRSHPVASVILPLTVDRDGVPTGVHNLDGDLLDPMVAAVLLCDAYFHTVVTDSSNNPLSTGRSVRFFTPAQKQALIARDGGCIFPGCEQPARRCAAHHRLPWEKGGTTDVENGALLCPRHHGLVHCARPWVILDYRMEDLPADLLQAHRARAASANLEPGETARVFRSPDGELLLAQNSVDHRGPAPPRRRTAA